MPTTKKRTIELMDIYNPYETQAWPLTGFIQTLLDICADADTAPESVTFTIRSESDYEGGQTVNITLTRLETDEEYAQRRAKEEDKLARDHKEMEQWQEAHEHQTLNLLLSKYGLPPEFQGDDDSAPLQSNTLEG